MGPCQGGFCAPRVAGLTTACAHRSAADSTEGLRTFLRHRWIGLWTILHGEQVRETALDFWMLQGALDIEDIPSETPPPSIATALTDAEDGVQEPGELAAAIAALALDPATAPACATRAPGTTTRQEALA